VLLALDGLSSKPSGFHCSAELRFAWLDAHSSGRSSSRRISATEGHAPSKQSDANNAVR